MLSVSLRFRHLSATQGDPTAHAEMLCIREGSKSLNGWQNLVRCSDLPLSPHHLTSTAVLDVPLAVTVRVAAAISHAFSSPRLSATRAPPSAARRQRRRCTSRSSRARCVRARSSRRASEQLSGERRIHFSEPTVRFYSTTEPPALMMMLESCARACAEEQLSFKKSPTYV